MEIPREIIDNLHYSRFHTATDKLIRDSAERALGVLGPSAQKVLISRMYQTLRLPVSDFMCSYSSLRIALTRILGQGARVILSDIDKSIIQALGSERVLVKTSLETYLEEIQKQELLDRIGDLGNRHMVHFSNSCEKKNEVLSAFFNDGSVPVQMLQFRPLGSSIESHVSPISEGRPERIVGDATGFEGRIPRDLLQVDERMGKSHIRYPTICIYSSSVCDTSDLGNIISSHSEVIFDSPYTLYSSLT
ncbi:MAG: hypothetical protein ACE1ZC_05375 [Nitrososphaerales archaeon]